MRAPAAALLVVALVALAVPAASAQAGVERPPIALVMDVSGSMAEDDGTGTVKIDGAKLALLDFLDEVETGATIGLRTYPDQDSSEACNDGKQQFDVARRNPVEMAARIREMGPDGDTPTAETLRAAAAALPEGGTLVLVSDGESTCEDPCEAADEIRAQGVDLETITVGFQISEEGEKELRCIAEALDGTFVDASDSETLRETFDRISRPDLAVTLEGAYPRKVSVRELGDKDGLVGVTATVENLTKVQARNVQLRFRFKGRGPGIREPIRAVGNLDAGATATRRWTFRPSLVLRGQTLSFEVAARAENIRAATLATGSIEVVDDARAEDAGPLLYDGGRRKRIAILGDSYSSGEGAGSYIGATDTADNHCHRSRRTYLVADFELPDSNILACSGAVAVDVTAPSSSGQKGVPAQTKELAGLYGKRPGRVEAAVLTLGGNDAKFATLVEACLLSTTPCSKKVEGKDAGEWKRKMLDPDEQAATLPDALPTAYAAINAVLNGDHLVEDRGGVAPILVLAYPMPTPLTGRSCPPMLNLVSDAEFRFVGGFLADLNGAIEKATLEARDDGVPAFFVPTPEPSFLPDHTVCDGEPWARALNSISGFRLLEAASGIPGPAPTMLKRVRSAFNRAERAKRELVHPKLEGYTAVTKALIRWSRTKDADSAADFLASAEPVDTDLPTWKRSDVDLGQIEGGKLPVLQGGTTYPLSVDGFGPGTRLSVTVNSSPRLLAVVEADSDGKARAQVSIPPDLHDGTHRLVIEGVDEQNRPRRIEGPVNVDGRKKPIVERLGVPGGFVLLATLTLFGWALVLAGERARARGSAA